MRGGKVNAFARSFTEFIFLQNPVNKDCKGFFFKI